MDQEYLDSLKTEAEKRKVYLRRKGEAFEGVVAGAIAALVFGAMAFLLTAMATDGGRCGAVPCSTSGATLGLAFPCILLPAALAAVGIWLCCTSISDAASIRYVPPVRETAETLPDRQVLVRGSEQPDSTDVLLRAVHRASATDAEQLVRADTGLRSRPR